MPNQPVKLEFPLGGIVRATAYQSQHPHTCYAAQNVYPLDATEKRIRGGRRPGTVKIPSVQILNGGAQRFLTTIKTSGGEVLVWGVGGKVYYTANGTAINTCSTSLHSTSGVIGVAERLGVMYIAEVSDTSNPLKTFTPGTGAMANLTASRGSFPAGCGLIAQYRDRIVMAVRNGHQWYMSRQGNPLDWDYGADVDDGGRAISAPLSNAGNLGEPITALMPVGDEHLLFGCANSTWRLSGDPAWGGRLECVDRTFGPISAAAWCSGAGGEVYYLTRGGVMRFAGRPESVSAAKLPVELLDVDTSANQVCVVFDRANWGLHVFVTPTTGDGTHWFLHIPTESWWSTVFPEEQQPMFACGYAPSGTGARVAVMLGRDGYTRKFDSTALRDDAEDIEAYVILGPYLIGGDEYHEGFLSELQGVLDASSAQVDFEVYSSDTAEGAVQSSTALASGIFEPGRSRRYYPRIRGMALAVKLEGAGLWFFESLVATMRQVGASRIR